MPKRPLKIRPTYRAHTDEQYREAIRAALPEGSILFDYFANIAYEEIDGTNEWSRGLAEGMRRLALNVLATALDQPVKVETEEDSV